MSLVGPRPLLIEYLDRYSPRQARRHEVLPGITGWAQVNGRNALTWEQKFDYDVLYVDNVSLAVDIRILLKTLTRVACGGASRRTTASRCRSFTEARYDRHHAARSDRHAASAPSPRRPVATTTHGDVRALPSLDSRTVVRYRLHSCRCPDSRAGRAAPHPAGRAAVSPAAVRLRGATARPRRRRHIPRPWTRDAAASGVACPTIYRSTPTAVLLPLLSRHSPGRFIRAHATHRRHCQPARGARMRRRGHCARNRRSGVKSWLVCERNGC